MPPLLHDPAVRDAVRGRILTLRSDSPRKWGKMSVDQMLWHCSQSMGQALGQVPSTLVRVPVPRSMMKFFVLNMPWPKGAPTAPELTAIKRYSFDTEHARCLQFLDAFTTKGIDAHDWGSSPAFGPLNGTEWSRLQAKHLDHHLRQFDT